MSALSKISLAVALSLSALGAQAGTITYTVNTTPAVIPLGTTTANWTGGGANVVQIPQFNLGFTLTGVSISFFGHANIHYDATNNDPVADAVILDPSGASVRETFTGPGIVSTGLNILPGASITGGFDIPLPANGGNTIFNGAGDDSHLNHNPIGVNGASLGTFTGGGLLTYNVGGLFIQSTQVTGGNVAQNGNGTGSATMTVTYTWQDSTTVPEPGSMALVGVGLAALASRRRKLVK